MSICSDNGPLCIYRHSSMALIQRILLIIFDSKKIPPKVFMLLSRLKSYPVAIIIQFIIFL